MTWYARDLTSLISERSRGRHLEVGTPYAAPDSVCRSLAPLGGTRPEQDPRAAFAELGCDRLAHAARSAGDKKGGPVLSASRTSQSPVATIPAFSIMITALRIGTTGRCSIPAGTLKAWFGLSTTVS